MFKKTKEKINQNEYVIFIKKVWDNKRYRSLLILVLYFIFFFVIITGLRSTYQDSENMNNDESNNVFSFEELKESYNNLRDYSYDIIVNEKVLVTGKLEDGINNFTYDEEQYTIINNNLYKDEDGDLKKYDFIEENIILDIIDKVMLDNLINYVSSLNSNGVINEDSFDLDFLLPNSYFSIEEEGNVEVSILGETKTKISEIIIDLTEYKNEVYIITVRISDNND